MLQSGGSQECCGMAKDDLAKLQAPLCFAMMCSMFHDVLHCDLLLRLPTLRERTVVCDSTTTIIHYYPFTWLSYPLLSARILGNQFLREQGERDNRGTCTVAMHMIVWLVCD
jgi:hypothetical protein